MQTLKICVIQPDGQIEQDGNQNSRSQVVKFWSVFASEEITDFNITALYSVTKLPRIVIEDTTNEEMDNFLQLIMSFKKAVQQSTQPCVCCCRRTSCGFFYSGIFGTLNQMRFILEKNFDGRHFSIPSHLDNTKIDAMFFPASTERTLTKKELEQTTQQPAYLKMPTIIMCNPNAFFYQHMVSQPNAFWLNFFLKKGINVMGWNYRGYGDTPGTPSPYNVKTDGESVLLFLQNELMLTGKVGVYGRSLGGIVASHLAAAFPNKIQFLLADRTFGSLKDVSIRKFIGKGASGLFDLAPCFKIAVCDPKDEVVDEYAALITQSCQYAAKQLLKNEFMNQEIRQNFFRLLCEAFLIESFLFQETQKQKQNGVIQSPSKLNSKSNERQKSYLMKNDGKFTECLIDINLEESNNFFSINFQKGTFSNEQDFKSGTMASMRSKMTEEEKIREKDMLSSINLENVIQQVKVSGCKPSDSIVEHFRILILLLNDFSGGVIKMGSVCNINRMKKFADFETQREKTKTDLMNIIYQLSQTQQLVKKELGTQQLGKLLVYLLGYLQMCFEELYDYICQIVTKNSISYEHVGHIVPFKQGHKGKPNKSEEKLLENLLRESGFIFNPYGVSRFMTESQKPKQGDQESPQIEVFQSRVESKTELKSNRKTIHNSKNDLDDIHIELEEQPIDTPMKELFDQIIEEDVQNSAISKKKVERIHIHSSQLDQINGIRITKVARSNKHNATNKSHNLSLSLSQGHISDDNIVINRVIINQNYELKRDQYSFNDKEDIWKSKGDKFHNKNKLQRQ
eukprot:403359863